MPLRATWAERMFGGWGIYADALCVALIAADRQYPAAGAAGAADGGRRAVDRTKRPLCLAVTGLR